MKHRVIDTPQGQVELVLRGDLIDWDCNALYALLLTMPELFTLSEFGEVIPTGIDVSYGRRIPLIARQLSIFNFFFITYAFVDSKSIKIWVQLSNQEKHNVILEYMKYHNFQAYEDDMLDKFNQELRKL